MVNQFQVKKMKKIYVLLRMRNKQGFSIHFKDINFITENLSLTEKDKRSRVKFNKPIFPGQSCLDENIVTQVYI